MGDEKMVQNMEKHLKTALDWKQWMVDDLRILIDIAKSDKLSDDVLHELVFHHLKTYGLVNTQFGLLTGNDDIKLFDLPALEYLKQLIPTLDLSSDELDEMVEPMLELELDGLSDSLKDQIVSDDEPVTDDHVSVGDGGELITGDDFVIEPEPEPEELEPEHIEIDDVVVSELKHDGIDESVDDTTVSDGEQTTADTVESMMDRVWNRSHQLLSKTSVGEGVSDIDG